MNLTAWLHSVPHRVRWVLFGVLYALVNHACVSFFSIDGHVAIVWLPAGLALAVTLLGGMPYAGAAFVGELVAVLARGEPAGLALAVAMGNAASIALPAIFLRKSPRFDPGLPDFRDYLHLLLVGGLGCAFISLLVGIPALYLTDHLDRSNLALASLMWFAGDWIGVLVATPLILIWSRLPTGWNNTVRLREGILTVLLAGLVGQIVLLGWLNDSEGLVAKPYWPSVFVAAFTPRLWRHGIAVVLAVFALQSATGALEGVGVFARDGDTIRMANYWIFTTALCGFGMAGASYFENLIRTRQELARQEAAFRSQFADNKVMMLLVSADGRILDANSAAMGFFGYQPNLMAGKTLFELTTRPQADTRETLSKTALMGGDSFEAQHVLLNGQVCDLQVSTSAVRVGRRFMIHCIIFDITDRKRAEAEIENLAFYDPLTHLPNRRLLMDRLAQALANAQRAGHKGALLFIDLDHFKMLNDSHGHARGDELLVQCAQRLQACVRTGDTVARLGGDEFVVLLKVLDATPSTAAKQARTVADKLLKALATPYELGGGAIHHSSGSVGVALFGEKSDSIDELFQRADMALYGAKGMGRNAVRFFDPAMQAALVERAQLETELRLAVNQESFLLVYQPQVNDQGLLTGAEALLRWRHPALGVVTPGRFIALAEETGLILQIGHWALREACTQLAAWSKTPDLSTLTLSVNVSARQFRQQDFARQVMEVLLQTGAPAHRLRLELTESTAVDDVDEVVRKMAELRTVGVGFAIDDFGTGYSSLAYLKRMPLDELKIDQTFVRDLLTDPNDAAIARTILALGDSLGLGVTAEGVETEAQRDWLLAHGCLSMQGYLFGAPGPLDDLIQLAQRSHAKLLQDQRGTSPIPL
jgi:diguanylate cyclase (GGDEF)-like protein/PAS domain S-box-containing protein